MSEILQIAHDMAKAIHKRGGMSDITMREIETLCLPPRRDFSAAQIRSLRKVNHVSQAVFAALLGVGATTVQQWEMGHKKPSGPAAKLLDIVDRKGIEALV